MIIAVINTVQKSTLQNKKRSGFEFFAKFLQDKYKRKSAKLDD